MILHTVTLDLPEDIYDRAEREARTTEQSVEQVIISWITPPPPTAEELAREIAELEKLDNAELVQIARSTMPEDDVSRLRNLLTKQRERGLTEAEWREATALVEKEDWHTLRKARALYLLKKLNWAFILLTN